MTVLSQRQSGAWPEPAAVLTLLKPVTWFPPMWAYLCGAVSVGAALSANPTQLLIGVLLAGPIVCGMSQAANDWCDRHVDAINEPHRPIPSGRIPGNWGFRIALAMTGLALVVGTVLGPWGFAATLAAVAAAWVYSAEPLRLKRSGILGPGLVGLSYETLPWFTGAAVMSGGLPRWEIIVIATLYGVGAHGIMTLNDFKALKGDLETGVRSLPAMLGPERAARIACVVMALPQVAVASCLALWGHAWGAAVIALSLALQVLAMRRMLTDPRALAPWYNATGVTLYVGGMMVAAVALRTVGGP